MIKEENVYLRGFGSFILKKRAQKTARNISKNTTMIVPAHNIPAFKPAKEFVEKLKKRFNELVPQFQTIPAFIDEQALILKKAQELNFQVWDINEYVDWTGCPSLGSYEAEVEFLKDFFTKRLEWMRNAINKM